MAAPTLNNVTGGSGAGGTFTSSEYTPTPNASHLIVLPGLNHGAGPSITSVKYDGNDLIQRVATTQGAALSQIWALDDPLSKAASGAVVVVYSGGIDYHFIGSIVGAAAGAPEVPATTENASSESLALAITSLTDNSLLITQGSVMNDFDMSVSGDHAQPTPDVGQGSAARFAIGQQTVATAGLETPTYTWSTALPNCGVVAAFAPLAESETGDGVGAIGWNTETNLPPAHLIEMASLFGGHIPNYIFESGTGPGPSGLEWMVQLSEPYPYRVTARPDLYVPACTFVGEEDDWVVTPGGQWGLIPPGRKNRRLETDVWW